MINRIISPGSTAACRMKNRDSVLSLYVSPASSIRLAKTPKYGTVSQMFAATVAPQKLSCSNTKL